MDTAKAKTILLVEDDQLDVLTVRRALRDLNAPAQLDVTGNGEEALRYLRQEGQQKPSLILLDLNMPRMNGIEFLQEMRRDPALRDIPVVVLTTSREEEERKKSMELGAAGYIIKPMDYHQFVEMVQALSHYWSITAPVV